MKKTIALFAVLVFCQIHPASIFATNDDVKTDDIQLIAIHKPDPEDIKTRSLLPDVEARVNYDAGQIEVCFNKDLGVATVQLFDAMGLLIDARYCDSVLEGAAYLALPAENGAYTLKIFTDFADYVGNFVLMR